MFPGEFTLLWMKGTVGLNAWGKIFVFIENLIPYKSKESVRYTVHLVVD